MRHLKKINQEGNQKTSNREKSNSENNPVDLMSQIEEDIRNIEEKSRAEKIEIFVTASKLYNALVRMNDALKAVIEKDDLSQLQENFADWLPESKKIILVNYKTASVN